jgi:hypothetical protein
VVRRPVPCIEPTANDSATTSSPYCSNRSRRSVSRLACLTSNRIHPSPQALRCHAVCTFMPAARSAGDRPPAFTPRESGPDNHGQKHHGQVTVTIESGGQVSVHRICRSRRGAAVARGAPNLPLSETAWRANLPLRKTVWRKNESNWLDRRDAQT